jgi:hypothetical protein
MTSGFVVFIGSVGPSRPIERGTTMSRRFEPSDVADELPAAGFYEGIIRRALWRESERGSRMVQVVYALSGVGAAYGCVAEYFVLEGASERGAAMARRRLVDVYRACGLEPQAGEALGLARLVGRRLLVRVEHDEYNGRPRLRVAGHRPAELDEASSC